MPAAYTPRLSTTGLAADIRALDGIAQVRVIAPNRHRGAMLRVTLDQIDHQTGRAIYTDFTLPEAREWLALEQAKVATRTPVMTPAETIARTPIASVVVRATAAIHGIHLPAGRIADDILAAIREQGLVIVDPAEACAQCGDPRSAHGEWSEDLTHTFDDGPTVTLTKVES